ncbi:MAG TPA: hypothetical protein VK195_10240 [Burkholderiaceae bacterium]|nr:hypothetical protein [Burkholderiaceae bacterium]
MALASLFLKVLVAVAAAPLLCGASAAQDLTPASGRYDGVALEGGRLQSIGQVQIDCRAPAIRCRVTLTPSGLDIDPIVADVARDAAFGQLIAARLAGAARGGWAGGADAAYRALDGRKLSACWAAKDEGSLLSGLCRFEQSRAAAQWVAVMADMSSSNSYSAGFVPVYLEVKK